MASFEDVGKALQMMGEVTGRVISPGAAAMMANALSEHSPESILIALEACLKELRYFPTVADIISRIEAKDGHPGAEEAWAMIPKDESGSVVWTGEMAEAYSVASSLLRSGDEIGARMAFKEKYAAVVKEARALKLAPMWSPSLGSDESGRTAAIMQAVEKNRMSLEHAEKITTAFIGKLPDRIAITCSSEPEVPPEEALARIRNITAMISKTVDGDE